MKATQSLLILVDTTATSFPEGQGWMRGPDEAEFDELVAGRAHAMRRTAYLMCGDWHQAEDLVQVAFMKLHASWHRVRRQEAFDAYLRLTIVNLHSSRLRRLRVEREWLSKETARLGGRTSGLPDVPAREDMWQLLQTLPARQRAVLVLRYYEDLSERETADARRCSGLAVKSLTARAMTALREGIRGEDA